MAAKIGILTFHCAHNYGAVLQAYATQKLLSDAGYEAEVIDYRPDYLVKPYRRFDIARFKGKDVVSTLRHIVSEILLVPTRTARYSVFDRFISERLQLSERVYPGPFQKKYDIVIVGSDQVWNRKITGGCFDGMYFGDYDTSCRYIADAVSMESETLSKEDAEYLKDHLRRFSAISVRESDLASLLAEQCGIKVAHIQDPVVQVRPEIWRELAKPYVHPKPYVLVYRLRDHVTIGGYVKKLASRLGADIIEVTPFPDGRKLFISRQCESVEGFLGLIAGASYVVTTSYHAMVFSVLFSRPFNCFRFRAGQDTRQSSFLQAVGLEDRMLPLGADVPEDIGCDFFDALERVGQLRELSADFILNSLSGNYE